MNILILGNPYFYNTLKSMGHQVISSNFHDSSDIAVKHPATWRQLCGILESRGFAPQLVFYADNGNFPCLIDPQNVTCTSIYYSIDTYCNPWHVTYAKAFDLTYVAQKDFLPLFTAESINAAWLPLFCMQEGNVKPFAERELPVSFVGTLGHPNNPERVPFLRKFESCQQINISSGDYHPVFSNSKIVLNQTAFGEINFRCFEAMAMGAALLMEKCENGFDEIFSPGENILPTFARNDAAMAARIAALFLGRPAALEAIAENGRSYALKMHGEQARSATLIKDAEKLLADGAWQARLHDAEKIAPFVKAAFGMIASELCGEEWLPYRQFFLSIATE